MTRPSDIPEDVYERAEIFCDEHRHIEDDRELVARALMAGQGAAPAPKGMTLKQSKAFAFIAEYQAANDGASPSFREIGAAIGGSRGNAHDLIRGMEARGVICRAPRRARSISIVQTRDVNGAHKFSGEA